jgi:hypothetical protein
MAPPRSSIHVQYISCTVLNVVSAGGPLSFPLPFPTPNPPLGPTRRSCASVARNMPLVILRQCLWTRRPRAFLGLAFKLLALRTQRNSLNLFIAAPVLIPQPPDFNKVTAPGDGVLHPVPRSHSHSPASAPASAAMLLFARPCCVGRPTWPPS